MVLGEALCSAPQRNILKKNETAEIANPVRAGFDQFLVQPHLEFCRAYKAKTPLKDRDSPQVVLRVYFALPL